MKSDIGYSTKKEVEAAYEEAADIQEEIEQLTRRLRVVDKEIFTGRREIKEKRKENPDEK